MRLTRRGLLGAAAAGVAATAYGVEYDAAVPGSTPSSTAPNAIVGGRRAQMRDGRSAGGDRVRSDHRNRRRGLNHGRMLLCHR